MTRLARWLAALMLYGPDAPFIKHDLEDMYARDRARGLSPSHAGRRYVRLVLASSASLVDATRMNMQNALMLDLRQAARTLARDRGFTLVATPEGFSLVRNGSARSAAVRKGLSADSLRADPAIVFEPA